MSEAPHALLVEDLAAALRTDPCAGLAEDEAARRLVHYGRNELPREGGPSGFRILLAQFQNLLILILLVAIVLSVVLGHAVEAAVIGVIALFSVLLGFFQEFRAEQALEALRRLASPGATVLRNGQVRDLAARELVPGDVILLAAGGIVPADGRLVNCASLALDEASLTGESVAVAKSTGPLPSGGVALGDRTNMVFASTAVASGRGRAVVVATGPLTEVGRIGTLLRTVRGAQTPLEANLHRVGRALALSAGAIVVLVAALGILQGRQVIEMVLFGIALAVAVVPEALPAVVTISLALGARSMARRNALIRKLPAVEALGSVAVICSDKTRTLTTGVMTARTVYCAGEILDVTGASYEPTGRFLRDGADVMLGPAVLDLLAAAALSTDAQLIHDGGRWCVRGDPTEGALLVLARKAGFAKADLERQWPRVAEVPFCAERKRMTTLHASAASGIAISKGAPEAILPACTFERTAHGDTPLREADRERWRSAAQEMSANALRILAVAQRAATVLDDAEDGLTLLGLIGMMDPPRPEAKAAIASCFAAGIRPVMITGDHPLTARAIAAELGLLRSGEVLSGVELDGLSDEELAQRVDAINVYARVSPAHKLRIVTALQQRGHVLAMTGDGVNDAPALKKADVGIAMGVGGTDVAKGAAAVVLADDNFATIVAAVEEGRAVYDNVRKYLMYLLSSNVGEILLMAGAVALGLPLPLTAVQILYVNLATDGLPALALAVDPHAPDLMRRRPRDVRSGILSRSVIALILAGGVWSAAVNLTLFVWARASGRPIAQAVTMTFVSLVLIQFFKAYSFRSESGSILDQPFANRWLNAAIAWELALLGAVLYAPILSSAFGTYPLTLADWIVVVGAALTIVPVLEAVKRLIRASGGGSGS